MPSPRSRFRAKLLEMEKSKPSAQPAVIDATGAVIGRLGTVVAKRLLRGETIVILNSEKAVVSGNVAAIKARYKFKLEVGTRRKGPYMPRVPHLLLKRTVRGMLPYQRPNGRAALKRLTCHIGVPPEFSSTSPEVVKDAIKPELVGMTLGEVSAFFGRPVEVKRVG